MAGAASQDRKSCEDMRKRGWRANMRRANFRDVLTDAFAVIGVEQPTQSLDGTADSLALRCDFMLEVKRRLPVGFVMEVAEKLTIAMPPEMIREVRASVAAGEYGSTSEAVRAALRVWRQQRIEVAASLDAVRARIRRSLDDPRPDMTLEEVDAALDAAFARAEKAIADGAA